MDKNLAISKERQDEYYKDFTSNTSNSSTVTVVIQVSIGISAIPTTFTRLILMGKGSSDDAAVKIVRAFLEGMEGTDNARLTALFGIHKLLEIRLII